VLCPYCHAELSKKLTETQRGPQIFSDSSPISLTNVKSLGGVSTTKVMQSAKRKERNFPNCQGIKNGNKSFGLPEQPTIFTMQTKFVCPHSDFEG
jgi:hypothetical protein